MRKLDISTTRCGIRQDESRMFRDVIASYTGIRSIKNELSDVMVMNLWRPLRDNLEEHYETT